MLSRAAESIYWMERYRERAENTARAVDCSLQLSLDAPAERESPWGPVVLASGDEELYKELGGTLSKKAAMNFLTFEERNPNSILSCLSKARDNARSVREIIAAEMWQELNTAYLYVRNAAADPAASPTPHEFYTRVKRHGQVFAGIADATMLRGEAWHFGRMGAMLERADKTSRLLDMKYFLLLPSVDDVGAPYDGLQWSALLDAVGALEFYRKKHRQILHADVVDFLVLNPDFPRSILHCLLELEKSLRALTGTPPGQPGNDAERLLGRLRSDLGFCRVEDVMRRGLHEFLNDVQVRLDEVNAALSTIFFTPSATHAAGHSHDQ